MDVAPPILRRAPLMVAALELRFPEAILVPDDLKRIRRELAEDYPITDTEQGIGIEIGLQGGGVRQQATIQRHVYKSRDGSHQFGLTPTTLVLEATAANYEGFESFLDRWLSVVGPVVGVLEVDTQIRLGLRYVNQLQVEDASPGLDAVVGRINPALLSPYGADGFEHAVITSVQELRLRNDVGKSALRHGLQSGEGTPRPGIYLLDIDFYDDDLIKRDGEQEKEKLKRFNHEIWKIFRWAITDEEFARMEPEERK